MGWKRRIGYIILVLIILGVVGNFPGSSQSPDPVVLSMNKPAGELVKQEIEREGDEYRFRALLQNSGQAGDLFVTLWIGPETPEKLPDSKAGLESLGYERIRTGTFYFNSGERRWMSFTEADIGEVDAYAFYGFASTYSAVIENKGETGPVEMSFAWNDSDTSNQKIIESKTITIQGGSTKEVEFNVKKHPQFHYPEKEYDTWEILVEPV